jgi:hypothetical protein
VHVLSFSLSLSLSLSLRLSVFFSLSLTRSLLPPSPSPSFSLQSGSMGENTRLVYTHYRYGQFLTTLSLSRKVEN